MIPKFRVWHKNNKKMITNDDVVNISFEDEEICVQTLYFEEGLISERDLDYYGFDEIELMQSTGLKDKNGKEIFEGDILCDEGIEQEDEFVYVSVSSKEGMWICTQITNEGCGYGGALNEFVSDYSIIGNIYKNPELLEVVE